MPVASDGRYRTTRRDRKIARDHWLSGHHQGRWRRRWSRHARGAGEATLINGQTVTSAEALAAFGNPDGLHGKFLENPRHIEVQVLADQHGT